ncbi:hypothetical protein FHS56_002196 [Thermonema lapsum]|uniref:Uncharacterized protein n=1 Tax=Thermonema lapsum TaxID=28195 RepID=A0A846MTW5_9BACT|nr:hypothetical protein [Thermonema lapsum]NIK74667.1 hypothetical protein [Thermonema lapsum]
MKQLRIHITSFRFAYMGGLLVFLLCRFASVQQAALHEAQLQQLPKVTEPTHSQDGNQQEDPAQKNYWEQDIAQKALLSVLRFDFKHPFLFLFNISLPAPENTRIAFPDFSPRLIYYEQLFRYFVVVNAP